MASKILGTRAHIEVAKVNREENVAYCSKEGSVVILYETSTEPLTPARLHAAQVLEAAKR
jgi:hypothetical protein